MFEESRVDFLQQAGLPFDEIESMGILVPVLSARCQYISPLTFDEPFAVYHKIEKFNGTRLEITYKIISRKTGKLCVEGKTKHCFTDKDMKPIRLKVRYPEVYDFFEKYTGYETTDDSED